MNHVYLIKSDDFPRKTIIDAVASRSITFQELSSPDILIHTDLSLSELKKALPKNIGESLYCEVICIDTDDPQWLSKTLHTSSDL